MNDCTARDIAKMIDHSMLNPVLSRQQVIDGCRLAKLYDVATVCVKPCDVDIAREVLAGSDVLITTVIAFPHGSNLTAVKVYEAEKAISQGCRELDMVLNIGRLLSEEYDYVEADIRAVIDLAHKSGVVVKVILENAYLTPEMITRACYICEAAGADFVKTSSGYAKSGAALEDLRRMRASTSSRMRIKAAGGVRSLDAALAVRAVGAARFGCTVTENIILEARRREASGMLLLPENPQSLD